MSKISAIGEKSVIRISALGVPGAPGASGAPQIKPREKWDRKMDFILSLIGYAVGLGNVWRFPYLAGKHGGAAFLIPYATMLIVAAWPMFFMELNLGQYSGLSPQKIYSRMAPIFSGLGWSMVIIQTYTSIYYNMILAWALRYLVASFTLDLPWDSCDEYWNTKNCLDDRKKIECEKNATFYANGTCFEEKFLLEWDPNFRQILMERYDEKNSKSAAEEYLYRRIFNLHESQGIDDLGKPQWELVVCLFFAWVLVFACICRGIKTSGKVVYFTSTFPYLILLILLIRGATLEGAYKGIEFYMIPNVSKLANGQAWGDAAQQVFFSLSLGGGGLTTLASYNGFHDNTMRDTLIVVLGDSFTSLFAGFVIFSILGFIAHSLGKSVEAVAASGSGLAFVAYPDAVARMPVAPLWAILFFLMVVILGIDTQMVLTEVVIASILDKYPKMRRCRNKMFVVFLVCFASFLIGIILTTSGGPYVLNLIDNYAGGYPLVIACFIEICLISYVYGLQRFIGDIRVMLGEPPTYYWKILGYPVNPYFKITWAAVTPVVLLGSLIFMFATFERSTYYNYTYPLWADILGWFMTLSCVILVPISAIYLIVKQIINGRPLKELMKPTDKWGPQETSELSQKNQLELELQHSNGISAANFQKH